VASDLGVEIFDQRGKMGFEYRGEAANPYLVLVGPDDVRLQVLVAAINLLRILHRPAPSNERRERLAGRTATLPVSGIKAGSAAPIVCDLKVGGVALIGPSSLRSTGRERR